MCQANTAWTVIASHLWSDKVQDLQNTVLRQHSNSADRDGSVCVGDVVGGIVAQGATVVEGHCVSLIVQVSVVQVCA